MNAPKTLFPVLLLSLAACGGAERAPTNPPPATTTTTTTTTPQVPQAAIDGGVGTAGTADPPTAPVPPATGNMTMSASIEAFNADLYAKLESQKGNVFYSAASIEYALAMTAAGAKGQTATEMQNTLHLGNAATTGPSAKAFMTTWSTPQPNGPTLAIANRLWGQQGYAFQPDYLQNTKAWYGADLGQLDFKKAPDASRKTINDWVSEKTNKKIPDLLPADAITPSTRLVLTNAVYFKGTWRTKFDPKTTAPAPFKTASGNIQAQTMHAHFDHGSYADVGDAEVLAIPYTGDATHRLSMLVVLPKAGKTIGTVEGELNGTALSKWSAACSDAEVKLSLPKFRTSSSFELAPVLQSMGMSLPFGSSADFSGIAQKGEAPLSISAVIHKAFVDVNEEGTEAAAATAVVMTDAAAMPPAKTVDFKVDHPFLFFIRDDASGTVLFSGRIEDPTK